MERSVIIVGGGVAVSGLAGKFPIGVSGWSPKLSPMAAITRVQGQAQAPNAKVRRKLRREIVEPTDITPPINTQMAGSRNCWT